MFEQKKKADADFKFASAIFIEPELMYENHLALKIYNIVADGNQGLNPDWFEFCIKLYNIEDVVYFFEALFTIRSIISNFDDEIKNLKNKGEEINNEVVNILQKSGKFMRE